MPKISETFDPSSVTEWRRVTDSTCKEYKIDSEYTLLGYDIENGRLDMLLRYAPGFGHCRKHRHVASTLTLVLEGEQNLRELQPDGSCKEVHQKKGDYALAPPDALAHHENGGEGGGTVFLSMSAPDGILFEYFDEDMKNGWTVSIEQYVEAWNKGEVHGAAPGY